MNGKRVKTAIMSAVILSAVAVSGCSVDGGVSHNESGVKADVSAFFNTSGKDESVKTESQASSDSKPASTTEKKPETTAVTTKNDSTTKSEWKETKSEGTRYVTVDCYSRNKAVLGAETVKLYNVNDKVTVVAVTDTGYAKLKDGTFIHTDYLSDSKVTVTTAPASTTTKKPAQQDPVQSQVSDEYSWVIKPSYAYDDVNILCSMSGKPVADIRLWDDNTDDHDSGEKLPVGFVVSQNNNYGLISLNGDLLMDCEYSYISMFSGFAEAMKADSSYSYTLGSDYEVHIMENAGHGGYATYYIYDDSNSKIGYIDPDGIIICDEYDMEKIANRAILLKSGTLDENNGCREDSVAKFGLMYKNRIIIPLIYDGGSDGNLVEYNPDIMEMCDVKDGRAVFWKNNKIYVFDKDGNCYSNGVYDKVDNGYQELNYFNGYLTVCKDGAWGLIDVNGNEVLTCQFEDITSVYDGKAWAKQNGKWGIIKLA